MAQAVKCSQCSVTCKPWKQLVVASNHTCNTMLQITFGTHSSGSGEIPECFIVSSVAKDCLVLSQYDLHHGIFLKVTGIKVNSHRTGTLMSVSQQHTVMTSCWFPRTSWYLHITDG